MIYSESGGMRFSNLGRSDLGRSNMIGPGLPQDKSFLYPCPVIFSFFIIFFNAGVRTLIDPFS